MSFINFVDKYIQYYQTLNNEQKYEIENNSDSEIHINRFARHIKCSIEDYNFLLISKGGWKTSNYDLIQQYVHNVLNEPIKNLKPTKKTKKLEVLQE